MTVSQKILDEAYPIITRLAKSRSGNGSFAYYTSSDVSQEVWCMCLEALERYDPTIGPIENYLVRHVTNRLKNLKRDKYFRPGSDVSTSGFARIRMNLVNALPLSGGDMTEQWVLLCGTPIGVDPIERLSCEETLQYIRDRLPDELLEPLDDLLSNNKVRGQVADSIRQYVIEILIERDEDVGD